MPPPKTRTPRPAPERPSRTRLYAPFAVLLLGVVVWTGAWIWMRNGVFRSMDAGARALTQAGYRIDWRTRSVSGYPFRLDLTVTGARLHDPAGWGLESPLLKAEAFAFAPGHWVVVAPDGGIFDRRRGGPVRVTAKVLRASLAEASAAPPRLSIEGMGLAFAALPGAAPVSITAADELHIHTKSGPRDQGAVYLEFDHARLAGGGPIALLAAGAPVTFVADGVYDHASALRGRGVEGALRGWSAAQGGLQVRRLRLVAGEAAADATSGMLRIAPDGRLAGELAVKLAPWSRIVGMLNARSPSQARPADPLRAMVAARAGAASTELQVHFQAGQMTLGPVAVGPAPRVY